jgi:hypothetical protein
MIDGKNPVIINLIDFIKKKYNYIFKYIKLLH